MGLIKAVTTAIGQGLGDQWKEVFEADNMGGQTVFTKAVPVRNDGSNGRGTTDIITNGSVIHVLPNQFMFIMDGGKVIDYTAEEGYYTVNSSSAPSLFNGQFKDTLKDVFGRIQYGGTNPQKQKAFFINLQEIKGIKFGTPAPLNYFDNFYNAELFVRAHGNYSIRITNPLLFYEQVIPKNTDHVEIDEINEQYLSEFLEGFSAALNTMSADGIRISYLASKAPELSKHMQTSLDEDWNQNRGFEVDHVAVASVSYTDESQKLINMRNQGAMMSDPSVREGFVQSAIASGIQAAGSNTAGAGTAFMGMGMGMGAAGGFMGAASQTNMQQMQMNQQSQQAQPQMVAGSAAAAAGWTCECGTANTGKFCANCGKAKPAPAAGWKCECGAENTGKFCSNCGKPMPASDEWTCECGTTNKGNFCANCGSKRP
ncbi:MAG: SPFH domain-containing protein [Eubacteriales bacterium]|nr:SPFH domain-containing protein [Eubacteriales bacterium]